LAENKKEKPDRKRATGAKGKITAMAEERGKSHRGNAGDPLTEEGKGHGVYGDRLPCAYPGGSKCGLPTSDPKKVPFGRSGGWSRVSRTRVRESPTAEETLMLHTYTESQKYHQGGPGEGGKGTRKRGGHQLYAGGIVAKIGPCEFTNIQPDRKKYRPRYLVALMTKKKCDRKLPGGNPRKGREGRGQIVVGRETTT